MRWVRRLADDLPRLEQNYFRQVAYWLDDVPEVRRKPMLEQCRDHLLDRPAAEEPADLTWTLGEPREYARAIRTDAGLGPERRDFWARWIALPAARRIRRVALVVVTLATVGTGIGIWSWWVDWQAQIVLPGFRPSFRPALPAGPPVSLETSDFPRARFVAQYDASRALYLEYQFLPDRPIRVDAISLPDSQLALGPVEVTRIDWRPSGAYVGRPGRPPPPIPTYRAWPPGVVEPKLDGVWVRLRLRFRNCGYWPSPSSFTFNQLRVRYHALDRERTAMLDLPTPVAIVGALPTDCARWASEGR